jgi:hypothetical protein
VRAPAELTDHRRVVTMALVAYAGTAALSQPLTATAAAAVAVPAVIVLLLAGTTRPAPPAAENRTRVRRTALAWGAVVVLAAVWDLTAWLQQPAYDVSAHAHPTISVLLDPVTEAWPWRPLAWGCWLYAGYRLVRR